MGGQLGLPKWSRCPEEGFRQRQEQVVMQEKAIHTPHPRGLCILSRAPSTHRAGGEPGLGGVPQAQPVAVG